MDKYKLEYERKRRGVSIIDLCKAINMSRSAFYRKCNGKSEFTLTEVNKICQYLNLESPMEIFFADKVS